MLAILTAILIGLSYVSLRVRSLPRLPAAVRAESASATGRADRYVRALRESDTWHERTPFASALEGMGD